MKHLAPTVTCILTSHMKPYLNDALYSLLGQTRQDFAALVIDSGAWRGQTDERSTAMHDIYREWQSHPMVEWVFTGERPGGLSCPVSVATNLAIRAGLVRGQYVCHFYDDDEYQPTFMERMAGFLDDRPEVAAVWCSQERARIERDGSRSVQGQIVATHTLGPGEIDCRVDGGQVMYRRSVLDALGDPWMPESAGDCSHSDGIFLERLASVVGRIEPLCENLITHRCTPISTYSPS